MFVPQFLYVSVSAWTFFFLLFLTFYEHLDRRMPDSKILEVLLRNEGQRHPRRAVSSGATIAIAPIGQTAHHTGVSVAAEDATTAAASLTFLPSDLPSPAA